VKKWLVFILFSLNVPLLAQVSISGQIKYFDQAVSELEIETSKQKTLTDSLGHFTIKQAAGDIKISTQYKGQYIELFTGKLADSTYIMQWDLASSTILNPVVITGLRYARPKMNNAVQVNILNTRALEMTQSTNLADGLCFQPGLRVETDCQTCNYTQLRMNGMGGSYSQILINNRPIFSSLMSLYGLEQIPSSLIDRVEVVRGGGSAIYGSGAVAGVVNIITKKPTKTELIFKHNSMLTAGTAADFTTSVASTQISKDKKLGLTFMGNHRKRNAFDANGDNFSELSGLDQMGLAASGYYIPNDLNELEFNVSQLNEERIGGEMLPKPADQLQQSEYRNHKILMADAAYTRYAPNKKSWWSTYLAGQNTRRDHYTGIDGSAGWGNTKSYTYQVGLQGVKEIGTKRPNTFTTGAEYLHDYTFDEIKGYNYKIDQTIKSLGLYIQSDWELTKKITLLTGARLNYHSRLNSPIITPRLSFMYKIAPLQRLRLAYSNAFKAPQAFETDMHIAFAAGGISRIIIDPQLKLEKSNGLNISWDWDKQKRKIIYGFTLTGFYTHLLNPFILQESYTDSQGNQILFRTNGASATVQGASLEFRLNYKQLIQLQSGYTLQQSQFSEPVAWSTETAAQRNFLRTPNSYGFFTLEYHPSNKWDIDLSSVFTGPMQVPHFSGAGSISQDEVKKSQPFLELNLRVAHTLSSKCTLHLGVQNILNAYQTDFDSGKNRDSNYVYGPARPRSIYAGFKFNL
jgi:outer membrane receptor for ferrienterochelin and colicins